MRAKKGKKKISKRNPLLEPHSVQTNRFIADIPERINRINANVRLRHDILQSQLRNNYRNEYDRIVGLIERSTIQGLRERELTRLNNRKNHLKDLVDKSLFETRTDYKY